MDLRSKAREWFIKLGCSVVATYTSKDGSHKPFIQWKIYENKVQTKGEFEDQLWDKADGYALVMGLTSSGKYLSLMDLDNHNKENWKDEDFKDIECWIEKSPHGYHVLILSDIKPKQCQDYVEIELLTHLCNMYDQPLNDLPIMDVKDAYITFTEAIDKFNLKPKKGIIQTQGFKVPFSIDKLLSTPVPKGDRNRAIIFIGSKLRGFGKSKEEIETILTEWNKLCIPPFEPDELRSKIKDLYRHEVPYFYHPEDTPLSLEITKELTLEDLNKILSTTIKGDYSLKTIIFLLALLTFTEDSQTGAIVTGESSLGKTYNIKQCLWFFPEDVVDTQAGASAKSFIHRASGILVDSETLSPIDYSMKPEKGDSADAWNEWYKILRNSGLLLDYSGKIFVLPDMENTDLLKVLRPILSHDNKISKFSIAEKTPNGFRTKDVFIRGFFTVFFASATTIIDEQESSRFFLLSPSDDKDKMKSSLDLISRINSDPEYAKWYENDPERCTLKHRVTAIRDFRCGQIYIPKELMSNLEQWFIEKTATINPKIQRDFPRLISLAKAWSLLNWKNRVTNVETNDLQCNQTDIDTAKKIYEEIIKCNELGLTPEEYNLWLLIREKVVDGLRISQIQDLYYQAKRRNISNRRLRGILTNFVRSGLIREEKEERGALVFYLAREEPVNDLSVEEQLTGQWVDNTDQIKDDRDQ